MEQNNTKVNGTVENDCNEEEALSPEEKSKREKVCYLCVYAVKFIIF